jgi:hypothetical protein
LYHSFSLGRNQVAPELREIVAAFEGTGAPPKRVYAPLSVDPLPWWLFIQLAKRNVDGPISAAVDDRVGKAAAHSRARAMPPRPAAIEVLYRPSGSLAALAFRNAAYCAFVTSVVPMR